MLERITHYFVKVHRASGFTHQMKLADSLFVKKIALSRNNTHYGKRGGAIMKDNKATMRKTIGWASLAYGAFTAISIIGPLILERLWSRKR